jgi:uncharacterized cupin superfamily protein
MMRVTRFADAPPYAPPLHRGVECKRLQGLNAGPTHRFWIGHSIYHPGAAADASPTMEETIYTVLSGEIVVITGGNEVILGPLDSVHLPKGETRSVENRSDKTATILVAIAIPQDQS